MYIFNGTEFELNIGIVIFIFIAFARGAIGNGIDLGERVINEKSSLIQAILFLAARLIL